MITNPVPATIVNPQLIDYAIEEIQAKLLAELSWLNEMYGKCFKMEEIVDGRKRTFPAIYIRGEEYFRLIPDENTGNFGFFDAKKGDQIEWARNRQMWITSEISLIFWFDFRSVYPADHQNRTVDHVKSELLRVLNVGNFSRSTIEIFNTYDVPIDVYRGYSMIYSDPEWIGKDRVAIEAGNLFFMRPFGCVRLDGTLRYLERC